MVQIPRSKFIAAIEAGIEAQPGVTDAAREALRKVGREAAKVGPLFIPTSPGDPCCPAAQAGLVGDERCFAFAARYDTTIEPIIRPQGGFPAMAREPARIV